MNVSSWRQSLKWNGVKMEFIFVQYCFLNRIVLRLLLQNREKQDSEEKNKLI